MNNQLAQTEEAVLAADEGDEWLCFKIAKESYCHEVLQIDEVLRYSEPTPVPGAPDYVLGILNIRGNVVSVFSGRALLGLAEKEPDDQFRIIIFRINGESFGVVVDQVVEISNIRKDQIEEYTKQQGDNSFLRGTVNHQGKLRIVVDFSFIDE